jgi:hypothetical protein
MWSKICDVIRIPYLRIEIQERSNFNRRLKKDVVHELDVRPLTRVHVRISPSQLEGLAHQESSKDFVESVPVFGLADD